MKTVSLWRRIHRETILTLLLIMVVVIAATVSCGHRVKCDLTISSTSGGLVAEPGEGTFAYDEGTIINLVAETEEGYHFANWTGDTGTVADVDAIATNVIMNNDYCITANFGVEIHDWYDLDHIRYHLDGHHILMNDLDSATPGYEQWASPTANEGKGWHPILSFDGTFDGRGHEIRDLFVNRPNAIEYDVGLFGTVENGGVIQNTGVVNASVTGYDYAGTLVGANGGTVRNCYATGIVSGSVAVGGLVGDNAHGSNVADCYSMANVSGLWCVGGLIGHNGGTVSNSYATGTVTGSSLERLDLGGFAGTNYQGQVINCYSTGSVHYEGATDPTDKGFVGSVDTRGSYQMTGNFWDTDTSNQASTAGNATGKTTVAMHDIGTFLGAAWKIVAVALNETNPAYIWNIVNHVTYPFLSWQPIL